MIPETHHSLCSNDKDIIFTTVCLEYSNVIHKEFINRQDNLIFLYVILVVI